MIKGQPGYKSQKSKSLQKEKQSIPQKEYKLFQQIKVKPYKLDEVQKLKETISEYRKLYSGTIFQLKCFSMLIQASKHTGQTHLQDNNFVYNLCYSESFLTLNECVKLIQSQFQRIVQQKLVKKDEYFGETQSFEFEKMETCDEKQLFRILPWNFKKKKLSYQQDQQNDNAIKGDYDILLSKTVTVDFHQKIMNSMRQKRQKIWIKENYNQLEDFKNKGKEAIFIFEAKKNIKDFNGFSINVIAKMKKIVQKVKNKELKQFLQNKILSTRIISILCQMLKNVIASRCGQHRFQSQNQRLSIMNEIKQQMNNPPKIKPVIMFYLIFNDCLKQKEILELLHPFQKIFQFWFEKLKVSLTIIGYNDDQKSQEYQEIMKIIKDQQDQKEKYEREKKIEREEKQREKKIEREEKQREKKRDREEKQKQEQKQTEKEEYQKQKQIEREEKQREKQPEKEKHSQFYQQVLSLIHQLREQVNKLNQKFQKFQKSQKNE